MLTLDLYASKKMSFVSLSFLRHHFCLSYTSTLTITILIRQKKGVDFYKNELFLILIKNERSWRWQTSSPEEMRSISSHSTPPPRTKNRTQKQSHHEGCTKTNFSGLLTNVLNLERVFSLSSGLSIYPPMTVLPRHHEGNIWPVPSL